jgi:glutamate synthase domain-containing protein 3
MKLMIDSFMEGVRKLDEILKYAKISGDVAEIDASDLKHKELNDLMRECVLRGARKLILKNVCGQRYIGTRLFFKDNVRVEIEIYGTPGNDLGAFLSGHRIVVYGNAQDGVGNTMDSGEIVVHGRAGDVVAMAMRGGKIFIRDSVGYRTAIHMKEYKERIPVLVVGGSAQDFLGEYMAGGRVVLLGLNLRDGKHKSHYIGTGMHGGIIYLRGTVEDYQLGKEVGVVEMEQEDWKFLEDVVGEFCEHFKFDKDEILAGKFMKLIPVSKRPYGKVYAY